MLTFFDMNLPPHGPMIDDMKTRSSAPAPGTGGNQPPPTGGLGGLTGGLTGTTRPGTGTSSTVNTPKQVSLASQRFLPYKLTIIELYWTSPMYIIDAITTPGVTPYITLVEAYLPEGGTSGSSGSSTGSSSRTTNNNTDDDNRRNRRTRDTDTTTTTTTTTTN